MITYDSLILGKKMGVVEPATYVDTTFCQREVLERLMEVKVRELFSILYIYRFLYLSGNLL